MSLFSSQESELLGSPSSLELAQEISEAREANKKLLDFSSQNTNLIIPDTMQESFKQAIELPSLFTQAQNIALPPPTPTEEPDSWTNEQRLIIYEHLRYHEEMTGIMKTIGEHGPIKKLPKLPKRPGSKLQSLVTNKKQKIIFNPQELHNHLKTNLADVKTAINREAFADNIFNEINSEEQVVTTLDKCVRNLKRNDAQSLMIYLQFGHFLSLCKEWHEREQQAGTIKETWAVWLKQKTGYSDVHGRKLRMIAGILYGYPKFFEVGLSFNFIFSKKKQIEEMLKIQEYSNFWKKLPVVQTTDQLAQSQ